MCGYVAAYIHSFYMLFCVERLSWTITFSELKCTVKQ
jgi:hypothetical protein